MNPMLEILVFTLNAIIVYFLADWILRQIEARRGAVLKNRQVFFFVIILLFALIRRQSISAIFPSSTPARRAARVRIGWGTRRRPHK